VRHVAARKLAADHGIVRDYVTYLVRHGKVHGCRLGTRWYINERSFTDFLIRREYEHSARRVKIAAQRRSEYWNAQAAGADSRRAISENAPPQRATPSASGGGLHLHLLRLSISIRMEPRGSKDVTVSHVGDESDVDLIQSAYPHMRRSGPVTDAIISV
jgi:hypothetical protein